MGFEFPLNKWIPKSKNRDGEMKARLLDRQDLFYYVFNKKELENVAE